MTSTAAQIRDAMLARVVALTPSLAASVKFRKYAERAMSGFEFRQWCEKNPTAAFRLVSIMDEGVVSQPTITNTDVEWIEREFLVQVAYPRDHRYGRDLGKDLHDAIESDMSQIEHSIGTNGYAATSIVTGGDAVVLTTGQSREDADACVFGQLRLSVQYWRAMP